MIDTDSLLRTTVGGYWPSVLSVQISQCLVKRLWLVLSKLGPRPLLKRCNYEMLFLLQATAVRVEWWSPFLHGPSQQCSVWIWLWIPRMFSKTCDYSVNRPMLFDPDWGTQPSSEWCSFRTCGYRQNRDCQRSCKGKVLIGKTALLCHSLLRKKTLDNLFCPVISLLLVTGW